jgi:hypothetical protein
MSEGKLHYAPIHGDIKTLHLPKSNKPLALCGGFPCTNISSIGNKEGIKDGKASSMFYEMVRLLDENQNIPYLFLENVANICKIGLADVIEELSRRNFDMYYLTKSASSLGGLHQRCRFFCLAVSRERLAQLKLTNPNDINEIHIDNDTNYDNLPKWTEEWPLRITYKGNTDDPTYDPNWISRAHALGNSVCCCVVREAFIELWKLYKNAPTIVETFKNIGRIKNLSSLSYPYNESGIIYDSYFCPLPPNTNAVEKIDIDISVKMPDGLRKFKSFPTCRRGATHPSILNERSLHDLPTILVNTEVAIAQMHASPFGMPEKIQGSIIPNIQYLEWIMAYPKDWTRINKKIKDIKQEAREAHELSDDISEIHDDTNATDQDNKQTKNAKKRKPRIVKDKKESKGTNAMHLFFKDNPGKDVRTITELWQSLDPIEKTKYMETAKANREIAVSQS